MLKKNRSTTVSYYIISLELVFEFLIDLIACVLFDAFCVFAIAVGLWKFQCFTPVSRINIPGASSDALRAPSEKALFRLCSHDAVHFQHFLARLVCVGWNMVEPELLGP